MNLIIESFEHNYRASRLLAMSKPVYTAIKSYSANEGVVIVVPDRKVAKTLALDLILYSTSEHYSFNAPLPTTNFSEKIVNHAFSYGIGIISEKTENEIINFFREKKIRILIITGNSC